MINNEKSNNTKENLQNKAFYLIRTKGYDNVTIDQICMELGLTKGAFYHYFKSKSDILLKIYKAAEGDLLNCYNESLHLPPIEQLRTVFDWYIDYFNDSRLDEVRLFLKAQIDVHYKNYPYTNKIQRMIMKNIIDQGIMQGCFKGNLNAQEITEYIFTYLFGIHYEWCAHSKEVNFEEEFNKFYYKYLLPLISID